MSTMQPGSARSAGVEGREAAIELLDICNRATDLPGLMRELTGYFHRLTGCEAVGVRLRDGEDYPYYVTRGFPAEFVAAETSLCGKGTDGALLRDSAGHPVLDCMCGNIIRGRFDPAKPFFTAHGSFWSSCTSELLATTTDADRQAKTRNRCNSEGYESVALLPLRTGGETFGLFQFNDPRRGRFTPELIAFWERLVDSVALAVAKLRSEEALREEHRRVEELQRRFTASLETCVAERTAELAAANRELETFAYSVSHDLRAPLRAIHGYAALLEEEAAGGLDASGRKLLGNIRRNALKMDRLITDILEFSRAGRVEMRRTAVDMDALVAEVLHDVLPAEEPVAIRAEALPAGFGDAALLRQVWSNLIGNAVKYSRQSPVRRIEIRGRRDPDRTVYEVRDTGIGFKPDDAGRLFGVFQRLHADGDIEGTGVGLAIVKRIVERHGGAVWAEGRPGEGATFSFSLPCGRTPAGAPEPASS